MKPEKHGVQIGLGASSISVIFVALCMMILSVLSYTHPLQNEKIAQREKLYQEAATKSDAGAQLLIDELRQCPERALQQDLKQSRVQSLLQEYTMKADWEQGKLLVTIPVQDARQLQPRLQKQGSVVHIKAWKIITKGDTLRWWRSNRC